MSVIIFIDCESIQIYLQFDLRGMVIFILNRLICYAWICVCKNQNKDFAQHEIHS